MNKQSVLFNEIREGIRLDRQPMRMIKRIVAGCMAFLFACILLPAFAAAEELPDPDAGTYCGRKAHTHTDACYEQVPVCGLAEGEGAHTHADACFTETETLICGLAEGEGAHCHGEGCYEERDVLICGLAEAEPHTHTDACYVEQRVLTCAEEHEHTDECCVVEKVLTCGLAETEGHVHTDACCGKERVLTCGWEESAGHVHTAACCIVERTLTCGLEESAGHVHADGCYVSNRICGLEEHTHTLACYADLTADVELKYQWERTVAKAHLTGDWAHDLVAVAKTQRGYKQSEKNYIVDEKGRKKYYTRYGDWYGSGNACYADWCAGFVAFCVYYAHVDLPTSFGCQRFVERLKEVERFHLAEEYAPRPGDIIFFRGDVENKSKATHVGIVVSVSGEKIKTIEGNRTNMVEYFTYAPNDPTILGYGELPQNPDYVAPAEGSDPQGNAPQ